MREIKFRGKRKDNEEWIYGYYLVNQFDEHVIANSKGVWMVYPETVSQFTGLKDKNGKEIYEGDVVKTFWQHDGHVNYDYELVGVIEWNVNDMCYSLDCSDQIIRFLSTYQTEELL